MSEQTYKAVEKAIREHLEEQREGGYLIAWALVVEYATIKTERDHISPVFLQVKEDQPWTLSRGLFEVAADRFRYTEVHSNE